MKFKHIEWSVDSENDVHVTNPTNGVWIFSPCSKSRDVRASPIDEWSFHVGFDDNPFCNPHTDPEWQENIENLLYGFYFDSLQIKEVMHLYRLLRMGLT